MRTTDLVPILVEKIGRAGPTYPPRRIDKHVPEQQAESTSEPIYTLIKAVGGLNESPNQTLHEAHVFNRPCVHIC